MAVKIWLHLGHLHCCHCNSVKCDKWLPSERILKSTASAVWLIKGLRKQPSEVSENVVPLPILDTISLAISLLYI